MVTSFQHTPAEGDDLFVADLVSDAAAQPPEVLQEARQVALNEPLLVNRLISPSAHATGVNVTLHLPGKSITEVPEVAAHARRLADDIRAAFPGIEIHLGGLSMLNNACSEAGLQHMQTLLPLMYLAMFVIKYRLLRSLTSTLGTLLIVRPERQHGPDDRHDHCLRPDRRSHGPAGASHDRRYQEPLPPGSRGGYVHCLTAPPPGAVV